MPAAVVANGITPARTASLDPADLPAFSLGAGDNRARPYDPMPLLLGEHRVFPDLSAPEYAVLGGTTTTLWRIFHFGVGDVEVSDEMLGTTPLGSLAGIEKQKSGPGGVITIAAGAVQTQPGPGALTDTTRHDLTIPDGTVEVHVTITGDVFRASSRGQRIAHSVSVRITVPGQAVRTVTLESDGRTPLRRTLRYAVAGASRTVSVQRVADPSDDERTSEELSWSALASVRRDTGSYGGQTRYALRSEADAQAPGRLGRFSAIGRQKVPVWRNNAWSAPEASRNPAWILRWYALGYRHNGQLLAGAGLPAARLDEAAIIAWGARCDAMQLRCDLWLTRAPPHDEMFRIIAQCGLAAHDWTADGRLTVIWERPGRPVSAVVTPGNIVAGSVRVEYPGSQTAEEIAARFVDPDADWDWSTIRRLAPGVTGPPRSTATLTLEGIASRRQAAIECNLQAARQVHHRRKIRWRMPEEGFEIARGEVVSMTHSLLDGGIAGRLAEGSTAARVILDRDLALDGAADSRMVFRPLTGAPHTTAVRAGAGTREIVLTDPLPFAPDHDGAQPFDVLWRYYPADRPPAKILVTAAAPVSRSEVEVEGIDEVDAYYAAATADLSEPIAAAVLRPPRVLRIEVGEALVRVGAGFAVEISAVLIVEGDWRGGTVTASLDGGDARIVARLLEGETQARWLEDPEGRLTVTATPGSAAAPFGESATAVYDIVGVTAPPALPTNFLVDVLGDGTRRFRWVPPADLDLAGIAIRYARGDLGNAVPWDDMTPLHRGLLTSSPWESAEPGIGEWLFAARSIDTGGRLSTGDVRVLLTLGAQRLGGALIWRCPGAEGWPGAITGAVRSGDGLDALESAGNYTWGDLTTWADWTSWGLGDGTQGAAAMSYTPPAEDLGAVLTFALRWSADTRGDVVFEARTGADQAALEAAGLGGLHRWRHAHRPVAAGALALHRGRHGGAPDGPSLLVRARPARRPAGPRFQHRQLAGLRGRGAPGAARRLPDRGRRRGRAPEHRGRLDLGAPEQEPADHPHLRRRRQRRRRDGRRDRERSARP